MSIDHVNDFFKATRTGEKHPRYHVRPAMVMADGFRLSVQASDMHYCSPRENNADSYSLVEICSDYPLRGFGRSDRSSVGYIYAFASVKKLNALIERHGGVSYTKTKGVRS